jgi:DNA-binding PadR family transcriptional regulator
MILAILRSKSAYPAQIVAMCPSLGRTSIYTTLRGLERDKLVLSSLWRARGDKSARRVYTITPQGLALVADSKSLGEV